MLKKVFSSRRATKSSLSSPICSCSAWKAGQEPRTSRRTTCAQLIGHIRLRSALRQALVYSRQRRSSAAACHIPTPVAAAQSDGSRACTTMHVSTDNKVQQRLQNRCFVFGPIPLASAFEAPTSIAHPALPRFNGSARATATVTSKEC